MRRRVPKLKHYWPWEITISHSSNGQVRQYTLETESLPRWPARSSRPSCSSSGQSRTSWIHTATRKGIILDLVFTNSNTLINGYFTIVNKQYSDHNILKICPSCEYRNQLKTQRKNHYPNPIYDYDLLNASNEDWIRYEVLMSKLSEDFDEKTKDEDTHEWLNRFNKIIEEAVTTFFDIKSL